MFRAVYPSLSPEMIVARAVHADSRGRRPSSVLPGFNPNKLLATAISYLKTLGSAPDLVSQAQRRFGSLVSAPDQGQLKALKNFWMHMGSARKAVTLTTANMYLKSARSEAPAAGIAFPEEQVSEILHDAAARGYDMYMDIARKAVTLTTANMYLMSARSEAGAAGIVFPEEQVPGILREAAERANS